MKANQFSKILTLGLVVACVVACKGGDTSAAPAGGSGGAAPVEIAFLTNNASDYWTIAKKGTEKAIADTPGVKVDFEIPPSGTAAEQKGLIDDMLSKGVQGIDMSPVDPANETDLINDTAKKVLVFTVDSDAPSSDRSCYVGSDNVAAGHMLGEQVLKALPNGGKIMCFVGKKDAQNASDRYKGIQDALKGSKVSIIDIRTDETDRAKAIANVNDTLTNYPDIAGLVGIWSYNGPAILSAVKAANKVGKVKIICFDEEADTIAGVEDGSITCTIVQNPYEFGRQSIELMAKVLRGDKSAIPASKQVIIPTRVIDKSNVAAFAADLKQKTGK
jgi:ribose transport system substrate-binding protein